MVVCKHRCLGNAESEERWGAEMGGRDMGERNSEIIRRKKAHANKAVCKSSMPKQYAKQTY